MSLFRKVSKPARPSFSVSRCYVDAILNHRMNQSRTETLSEMGQVS